jgi:WhiB family redox-sensing transcriptional regulator
MAEAAELSTVTRNIEAAQAYAERKRRPQPPSPSSIGRGAIGITNNGQPVQSTDKWQNPLVIEILAANNPVFDDPEDPLAWQKDSLCGQTDPEAFFPEKGGNVRMAKKVCTMCEVKLECLDYALENDERFGVWGGLSERERRKLQKSLKRQTAA